MQLNRILYFFLFIHTILPSLSHSAAAVATSVTKLMQIKYYLIIILYNILRQPARKKKRANFVRTIISSLPTTAPTFCAFFYIVFSFFFFFASEKLFVLRFVEFMSERRKKEKNNAWKILNEPVNVTILWI